MHHQLLGTELRVWLCAMLLQWHWFVTFSKPVFRISTIQHGSKFVWIEWILWLCLALYETVLFWNALVKTVEPLLIYISVEWFHLASYLYVVTIHNIGSESLQCDQSTGVCTCKVGVGGDSCDQCQDFHYGFSDSGCRLVVYLLVKQNYMSFDSMYGWVWLKNR